MCGGGIKAVAALSAALSVTDGIIGVASEGQSGWYVLYFSYSGVAFEGQSGWCVEQFCAVQGDI